MDKKISTYTLILAAFFTVAIFASNQADDKNPNKSNDAKTTHTDQLPQIVQSVDLDQPFNFAGEPLPMDNFDVRERLDRELMVNSYWHSSTILNIKNTARFFPMFEEKFKAYGIPEDFKYVSAAESSFRNVTSPAGAKGIWQFMKPVGASYGLEINSEVDERYHYEKATEAACKHILKQKERFGSWTLAAAAYNVGPTKLARQKEEQQAETFYDMNINSETNRYIFRLVALKEILSRPRDFGFYLEKEDLYPPLENYKTVEVTASIPSLATFAKQQGTSYRLLKVYNPWLISNKLTVSSSNKYLIKIPV